MYIDKDIDKSMQDEA